jgi:glycine/D-amino acid oxidase-like deaminating enzyme
MPPPATPNLPTPNFYFDPDAPGACIAGLRPYRNSSYRLEAETIGSKFFVHNYGHGGAGITLSWGCAAKVRDIVKAHVAATHETKVAVLGSGVMGLTAATRLRELGLQVTIYAARRWAETTSAKAGGQWAVSVVEYEGKQAELTQIIKTAYKDFKDSIGHGFGVSEQPNYTASPSHNLEVVMQLAPGLLPPRKSLARLPFEGHTQPGFVYQTLLIEPPVFLPKLEADLIARGVTFATSNPKFASKAEILSTVPEMTIVNCTGLGSMTLFSDTKMMPIKGQLAMLPAQPALQYLYGQDGYMFPRSDHVVIGGTFEVGVCDETPDKAVCQSLVDHMKGLFGQGPVMAMPGIHIHHPDHAPIVNPAIPVS